MAAGAGVFQRTVQVASTLVLMPLLLRVLGLAGFGVWGAASSLAWFSGLVDIGIGTALVTLVARSSASGNDEEARLQVSGALSFGCGIAGLMIAAALIASFVTGWQGSTGPYLIAVAGLALNVPLNSANNIWMALQKGYISGFWELVQTLLTLGGLVAAALVTRNVSVYVAITYGAIVVANAGSLIHLFVIHPELRPRGFVSLSSARRVVGEGFLLFALNLVGGASFLFDNVLTLQLLGPEASARMTIALRICMTGLGILLVMSQPMWPAFTEAVARSDRHWIRNSLLRGTAVLTGAAAAGSVVFLTFGERLLRLWLNSSLGIDQALLWAIAAWAVVQAIIRVPHLLLNGLSILRFQIAAFGTATIVAFCLKAPLARYLGVAGILFSTPATVLVIAFPAIIWRIVHWRSHSGEPKIPEQLVEAEFPPVI
jgi:O-antigen/teichoic acid export membrane protein